MFQGFYRSEETLHEQSQYVILRFQDRKLPFASVAIAPHAKQPPARLLAGAPVLLWGPWVSTWSGGDADCLGHFGALHPGRLGRKQRLGSGERSGHAVRWGEVESRRVFDMGPR